ncbi:MAG: tRNA1(Val) (adenine(37)-N6)-methyltransferase [Lachnospiraceae bacterium]|nr:tRNA1(Val) (adenine(37)-N6)-methyltransferase [Lachnospiraceae bacterium]
MLRKDDLGGGLWLYQDPEAFCFGIDAVLLAHFPEIREGERVMDLGCGYAPIPMILAGTYRDIPFTVTGLEIQPGIAETAQRSVEENGLSGQIRIIEGDIREAVPSFGAASFSLVTCNPPYMAAGTGIVGSNLRRAIARTELTVTLRDVIFQAAGLLGPEGRFAMIHRPFRLPEILSLMQEARLTPKRLRFVHPTADAEPTMILIEGVRGAKPYLRVAPPLIVYNDDRSYTQEISDIYSGLRRS